VSRLALTPTNVPASASDISTPTLRTGDMYYNTSVGLKIYNGSAWTIGPSLIVPISVSSIGLIIKGVASQTANLQEWQDSAGTVLTSIRSDGRLWAGTTTEGYATLQAKTYNVGALAASFEGITSGTQTVVYIKSIGAAQPGLVIRGATSQTANLQEWQNSAGTVLASINSSGLLIPSNGLLSANNLTGISAVGELATGFTYVKLGTASDFATAASINFGALVNIGSGGNAAFVPLAIRGSASQTADLQQWQNSSGSILSRIASNGVIKANVGLVAENNTSGNYTALQVNSYVPSGVGIIVKGAASQTANLQEWQNSSGTVFGSIGSGGAFDFQVGGHAITSYNTGQIMMRMFAPSGQTANIQNWYVNSTIVSSIGPAGNISILLNSASTVGLIVKGAPSQSAKLQEWQNNSGTTLASVNNNGVFETSASIYTPYLQPVNGGGSYLSLTQGNPVTANTSSASVVPFAVKGAASQTANLQEWRNSAGTVLASINASGNATFNTLTVNTNNTVYFGTSSGIYGTTVAIKTYTDSNVGLVVQATGSGQTGNLQNWNNSVGIVLAKISASGNIVAGDMAIATSSVSTIHISNGTIPSANPTGGGVLYVEAGALKFRGSSGTITTIAVA